MENHQKVEICLNYLSNLKEELQRLERAETEYIQFVVLVQTIEVLGAFLDAKPMKAREQSAKRFGAAVKYLLGGRYRLLNEKNMLYDKLRNQLVHTFIPGRDLLLLRNITKGKEHLQYSDGKLVLINQDFFRDIYAAIERLSELLTTGKLKPKTIALINEN
ncbi:MAG: hypothetical protein LBM07_03950 [Culturomica sp.]|jgi:hypothetical protein|nr:hypothetical protein [Culturomica sp.]